MLEKVQKMYEDFVSKARLSLSECDGAMISDKDCANPQAWGSVLDLVWATASGFRFCTFNMTFHAHICSDCERLFVDSRKLGKDNWIWNLRFPFDVLGQLHVQNPDATLPGALQAILDSKVDLTVCPEW